jgi:hypothetical protein
VRLGVVLLAFAAAATAGSGASGSAAPRPVHFTTLWRTAGEGTGRWYGGPRRFPDGTYVIRRLADAQFLAPAVLSSGRLAQLDRFPWSKRFLMVSVAVRPTTGYSTTVKRVSYRRVSPAIEQFCVVADVRKPAAGTAVEQRRTVSYHVVSIPRGRFGVTPPAAVVTLDTHGRILWKTGSYPLRPASCRSP